MTLLFVLSASDAVIKFLNYYTVFPDKDLPKPGELPEEVVEIGLALNRLHFYCGFDTIQHSVKLGQVLSSSFANALRAKIPAVFTNEDIKNLDSQISFFEKNNAELQQEIVAMLPSVFHTSQIASNRQIIASNYKKIAELHEKKNALIVKKYESTEQCRDIVTNDLKTVYGALRNVLLLARKELAFPIDETKYASMMQDTTDIAFNEIKNMNEELRHLVQERIKAF